MRTSWFRGVAALIIAGSVVLSLSCAHDQQLVSISILPTTQTFGASNIPVPADAGLSIQLRALGNYIHPPVTKDITGQVIWTTDDVQGQMVTVSPSGVLTAVGGACGNSLVFATVNTNHSVGNRSSSGAIVTGQMTANVVCFTGSNGNTALLSILITPAGDGTVSVSAAGQSTVTCTQNCTLSFPVGTGPITLTAAPNTGFNFVGYSNCQSQAGLQCTINTLDVDTTVTASFQ